MLNRCRPSRSSRWRCCGSALGADAIVFTLLHSVVWPVALNMHTGFMGVSETQRMVGRNYGLRGIRYVVKLLIPAAFPSILTGMKIGWA